MAYYDLHLFFCINSRVNGRKSCSDFNAQEMRDYLQDKVRTAGMHKNGFVRINTAGCMRRCSDGPVLVIYPEGTWYTYKDKNDIDEILEVHINNGKIVQRLLISDSFSSLK